MDEINVTPLIDVVLVLLIIFMVLTPTTLTKMPAELPPEDQDEPPPPDPNDQPLVVAIYKDNSLALNLVPMGEPALADVLKKRLRGKVKDKRNVFVDAHPDSLYETVVHAVDLSRECGAARVGFADMKEEGPPVATPEQLEIMRTGALSPASPAAPEAAPP
jgi:biopolymer transport protein ExbD